MWPHMHIYFLVISGFIEVQYVIIHVMYINYKIHVLTAISNVRQIQYTYQ